MMRGILWPRFMDRDVARFNWGEVSYGWGLALDLSHRDSDDHDWTLHLGLIFLQVYVYLPLPKRKIVNRDGFGDSWGFSWRWGRDTGGIHVHWQDWYTILHMPWEPEWMRTSTLLKDGTWHHELRGDRNWRNHRDYLHENKWTAEHEYTYVLRSGEVQKRKATISIEEREWRWRWFTWLGLGRYRKGIWILPVWPKGPPVQQAPWVPLLGDTRRTIDVLFNEEVGERSGSWKGGTIGCGYEMRENETPLECLRRMERERKF